MARKTKDVVYVVKYCTGEEIERVTLRVPVDMDTVGNSALEARAIRKAGLNPWVVCDGCYDNRYHAECLSV